MVEKAERGETCLLRRLGRPLLAAAADSRETFFAIARGVAAYFLIDEGKMTDQRQKTLDQLLKSMEKPTPEALYHQLTR